MSERRKWMTVKGWTEGDHAYHEGVEVVDGVEVRWRYELNLEFQTTEQVVGVDADGEYIEYQRADASSSPDTSPSWEDARPFVDGWVRFDGCYHLNLGDEGYMHLCGNHGMDRLLAVLTRIRTLATELVPEFL